jgi:hypothetical protein
MIVDAVRVCMVIWSVLLFDANGQFAKAKVYLSACEGTVMFLPANSTTVPLLQLLACTDIDAPLLKLPLITICCDEFVCDAV